MSAPAIAARFGVTALTIALLFVALPLLGPA
jgi:hypothetical protein